MMDVLGKMKRVVIMSAEDTHKSFEKPGKQGIHGIAHTFHS